MTGVGAPDAEGRAGALNTAQFESAEERLADMDAQNVDMQVLSVPPTEFFYWLLAQDAVRANRLQHERFAEVVAEWPDRFTAVANAPLDHPLVAIEVLREARYDFGFRESRSAPTSSDATSTTVASIRFGRPSSNST